MVGLMNHLTFFFGCVIPEYLCHFCPHVDVGRYFSIVCPDSGRAHCSPTALVRISLHLLRIR